MGPIRENRAHCHLNTYYIKFMNKYLTMILSVLLCISVYMNFNYKHNGNIMEQNYIASIDTLKKIELKHQQILYEKQAYILKEQELVEMLNISKSEIVELKQKLKSSIQYIQTIQGEIKIDTINTIDTLYIQSDKDSSYIKFNYKDDWLNLSGTTFITPIPKTTIYNINIPVNLQTGLTKDNQIFIKTDNPYIQINDISGSTVYKPKYISYKLYAGFGIQYGLMEKHLDIGPQFGGGVVINF